MWSVFQELQITSDPSKQKALLLESLILVILYFKSFCEIFYILQIITQGLFLCPYPQIWLGHSVMCFTLEKIAVLV